MAEQSIAEVVAQAREDAEAANNHALRDEIDRLRTAIDRLTKERDEAREALRPFADIDKLIERLEAEAKEANAFGMMNASTFTAAANALQSLRSRVSELEAERDDYRARLATWLNDYSRTADGYTVHVPVYQIEHFTRLAARSTGPQAQVRAETSVSAAPDGWQLVPKDEMTDEMIRVATRYLRERSLNGRVSLPGTFNWHEFYAAILAASPTPPAAAPDGCSWCHKPGGEHDSGCPYEPTGPAASTTPPAAEAVGGALAETTAETGATVAPDSVDPTGLKDHLRALRNANEGFALVVWRASADGETGWDILSPKAAKEAESTLGWLMSIPGDVLMQSIPSIGTNGWLHAGEELQRERGAIAGRDGKSLSYALKGTGPAAPTASSDWPTGFRPDWKLTPQEQIAVTLNLALAKVPDWPGCTDEQLDALAEAVLSSPPVREIVGALSWYAEHVAACRKITREGDIARADLDRDGGNRARSILSRFQSVGGEKHDHADGTSAEAVEKVIQDTERRQ